MHVAGGFHIAHPSLMGVVQVPGPHSPCTLQLPFSQVLPVTPPSALRRFHFRDQVPPSPKRAFPALPVGSSHATDDGLLSLGPNYSGRAEGTRFGPRWRLCLQGEGHKAAPRYLVLCSKPTTPDQNASCPCGSQCCPPPPCLAVPHDDTFAQMSLGRILVAGEEAEAAISSGRERAGLWAVLLLARPLVCRHLLGTVATTTVLG